MYVTTLPSVSLPRSGRGPGVPTLSCSSKDPGTFLFATDTPYVVALRSCRTVRHSVVTCHSSRDSSGVPDDPGPVDNGQVFPRSPTQRSRLSQLLVVRARDLGTMTAEGVQPPTARTLPVPQWTLPTNVSLETRGRVSTLPSAHYALVCVECLSFYFASPTGTSPPTGIEGSPH